MLSQHPNTQDYCYRVCCYCHYLSVRLLSRVHPDMPPIAQQIFLHQKKCSSAFHSYPVVWVQSNIHYITFPWLWISYPHGISVVIALRSHLLELWERNIISKIVLFGEVSRQLNVEHLIFLNCMKIIVINEEPFRQNLLKNHSALGWRLLNCFLVS